MVYDVLEFKDREKWLESRNFGIGGSEAATIMGLSPWDSPVSLFARKSGLVEINNNQTEIMEWGHILEEPIADRYSKITGRELNDPGDYTIYQNKEYPYLMCTVDRDIYDLPKTPGVLEIKNVSSWKAKDWLEDPPVHYQIQLQHNLLVTGRSWGSFAVLFGGNRFGYLDVERHDKFCTHLHLLIEEFWHNVQIGKSPEVDSSEATEKALNTLYPEETGELVKLPAEVAEKDSRLAEIKEEMRALKEEKRGLESWIKNEIGDAEFGQYGDIKYKWSTIHKKAFEVKAKSYRQLRKIGVKG